ncbi:hypothetical protein B0H15DRAFT_1018883 [Mycena belliarum]|uniref:Uncharacterized protein n=1 Tax=Mycena belliarum TaxID=1033014 RepID=A0AAD6UIZ5_9AGAR|nr:hypothetical protein B0H15DRAFT_1018883 [Mycena belliae]
MLTKTMPVSPVTKFGFYKLKWPVVRVNSAKSGLSANTSPPRQRVPVNTRAHLLAHTSSRRPPPPCTLVVSAASPLQASPAASSPRSTPTEPAPNPPRVSLERCHVVRARCHVPASTPTPPRTTQPRTPLRQRLRCALRVRRSCSPPRQSTPPPPSSAAASLSYLPTQRNTDPPLLVPHRAATPPRPYSRASPPLRRRLGPAAAALRGPSRVEWGCPQPGRRPHGFPPPPLRATCTARLDPPAASRTHAPQTHRPRIGLAARSESQQARARKRSCRVTPVALPPRTQPPWSVQRRAQSSCCANGRLAQRRRERPTSTGLGVAAPTQAAQRTSRSARLVHTSPQNRVPGPRAVYGATQRARPPLRSCPATRRVGLPAPRARPPARRFCGSRAGHEARGTADPASRDGLDARGVRTNAGGAPTQRRGAPRLERAMYPAGSRAASPPSAFHARRRRELQSAADSKTWAPLVPRRLSVDAARRVTDARWAPRFAPSRGGAAAPRESAPLFARGAGRAAAA